MTNVDLLAQLEAREGGASKAGASVGVTPAVWSAWKHRKLPADGHLRVWLALQPGGRRLINRWLAERAAP